MSMESRKRFSAANGILIILFSLQLLSCTFTRLAEKSYSAAESKEPYDVIIVPGLPYDKEKTSSVMTTRMFWAKHLFDKGMARNVIFSGGAVYTPFVESIAMKTIADSLGIPAKNTFSETKAEHSTENVYYSYKLAKELGFSKIALATDPFQSAMLKSFMRKYTPGVDMIPVVYEMLDVQGKELPVIDTIPAYKKDFVSIKKREGFFKRFRGTMGKRVKEEKRLEEAALKKEQGRESEVANRE
jgi:uncharacterized SAM-binding protein YcdF (DUF218 family)